MPRRLLLAVLLFSFLTLSFAGSASAQDVSAAVGTQPRRTQTDVAVGAYVQYINGSNGNFIREGTNQAGGALLSVRQSYRSWLGYDVSYSYSRYTEHYYADAYRVKTNMHELTASYLLRTPHPYAGFEPFLTVGFGGIGFVPTSQGGNGYPKQLLPAFVYGVGVNRSVISDHIGVRLQFRSVTYKVPDFHEDLFDLHRLRKSLEPTLGVYYRF